MITREKSPYFRIIVLLCAIALIGLGGSPAFAEDFQPETPEILDGGTVENFEGEEVPPPVEGDESFGRSTQATFIPAWLCDPYQSGEVWTTYSYLQRYSTSGNGQWYCPVNLPSGARVTQLTYYYYDNDTSNLNLRFGRMNGQTSMSTYFNYSPPVSGGYWTTTWNTSQTIANASGWYWALFDLYAPAGSNHRFWGIRILWNRQIRTGLPKPFSDIFDQSIDFQNSIKALAASGITVGFPDGTFRPNNYVTRGQFAAFFARALGLYWAYSSGY